jgi:5-methylcytosine-specific restriction enzyme subunit McrC
MLCYAWDRLKEKDLAIVGQEEDKDIYNLLTRVLVKRLQSLFKKGFYREYYLFEEELGTLRGRLDFKESVRNFSFKRGKMVCHYDEITHDILHNQIIKTTLYHLLSNRVIDQNLKQDVRQMYLQFAEVSTIKLRPRLFSEVKIHRSNQHYGFLLDICKLLYDCLLINEEDSSTGFIDFERDHMAVAGLFERFVRNFYRKETSDYKVTSETIYWDTEDGFQGLLPKMQTDISLESQTKKIIMDTKFYQNALRENYGTEKLISGNLYQLFAYLSNNEWKSEKDLRAKGILLYPRVQKDLDVSYTIKGHQVKVCTVDLSKSWKTIHQSLMDIIVF